MNTLFRLLTSTLVLFILVFSLGCKKKDTIDSSKAFVKYYGGLNANFGVDVHQTADGGYIIAGTTSGSSTDLIVIKTNEQGDELWSKTFGGPNYDECGSIAVMPDGGYLVVGTYGITQRTWNVNALEITRDSTVMYAVRLDALGNERWSKTYPYSNSNTLIGTFGKSVAVGENGRCLLAGMVDSSYSIAGNIKVNLDIYGIIIDDNTNGNLYQAINPNTNALVNIRPLRYGAIDENDFTFNAIRAVNNEEYIISSSTILSGNNTPRLIQCRLNNTALLQNNAPTKTDWNDQSLVDGAQVVKANDNSYLLTGAASIGSTGNTSIYFNRLTSATMSSTSILKFGDQVSGKDIGQSVFASNDGGFVLLGVTNSLLYTENAEKLDDVVLFKLNGNGEQEWFKVFGGRGNDRASKVIQTADGGYVICGTIAFGDDISNSGSSNVISLLKLDEKGELNNIK